MRFGTARLHFPCSVPYSARVRGIPLIVEYWLEGKLKKAGGIGVVLLAAMMGLSAGVAAPAWAEDRITIAAMNDPEIRLYTADAEPVGSLKQGSEQASKAFPQSYAKTDVNDYGMLPLVIDDVLYYIDPMVVQTNTEPLECPTGSSVAGAGVRSTAGSGSKLCM